MINRKFVTQAREPFYELTRAYLDLNSKTLDIGAGDGSFSDYYKTTGFYLLDGNSSAINELRKVHKNVFMGKLPKLPFEDEMFQFIHCSHVVEHLNPEELYELLNEMNRCLKIEGYIAISAPLYWDKFYDDLSHIKPYNPYVFEKYLCSKENIVLSRSRISFNYKVVNLTYRYRKIYFYDKVEIESKNILARLILRITKKVFNKLFNIYEKTGFTIIFQKNH